MAFEMIDLDVDTSSVNASLLCKHAHAAGAYKQVASSGTEDANKRSMPKDASFYKVPRAGTMIGFQPSSSVKKF